MFAKFFTSTVRRPLRTRLTLERLEDRCVPAFTASLNATTGALSITGTAAADIISIREDAAQGAYRIAEADGVTGLRIFSNVRSITVDMQGTPTGATDALVLFGNVSATSFLTGGLRITGAGGLDVGFTSGFNVIGAVDVSTTGSSSDLSVTIGVRVFVFAESVSLGATTISNRGTGNTTIEVLGANSGATFTAGISATMGSGSNRLNLLGVSIAGGLMHSGTGPAAVNMNRTNVGGFVSLNGTGTNSSITADVVNSTIGTFFSVASGNGADAVTVDNTAVLGLGLQPQQQTFGVDLKGGANRSRIGTAGANSNNVIHGSLFHFGAGTETFELRNYTITSFVTVNARAGNFGITTTIADSKISSFLSFAGAGDAPDNVTVSNLSIGQNFAMDLGGGRNTTTVTNCTYLGSYSQIDIGNDTVTFSGNTGFGDVRISSGSLTIPGGAFVNNRIAGHASFIATRNSTESVILLGALPNDAASAANLVSIGKTLTVDLGERSLIGADTVLAKNVIVKENVTITSLQVALRSMSVGGNLNITAGDLITVPSVRIPATVNLTGPFRVVGNLTITTDLTNDRVVLGDATILGSTLINTNAGQDTVDFEAQAGSPNGHSQFFGPVQVGLGNDNDTITVGTDASNAAEFFSSVLFAGGDGDDTVNETFPRFFGGAPTFS